MMIQRLKLKISHFVKGAIFMINLVVIVLEKKLENAIKNIVVIK